MEAAYIDLDRELEDAIEKERTDTRSFPLRPLLHIYMRTYPLLYTEYHAGLKELVRWLQPISIGIHSTPYRPLPEQLRSWELNELSKIIGTSEENLFYMILSIHREGH